MVGFPWLFAIVLGLAFQQVVTLAREFNFSRTAPIHGFGIVNAFPGVDFSQPVGIALIPGETNRLFVLERPGRIMEVTNLANPSKQIFLDLSSSTHLVGIETGLLGLAFHPEFATNGRFFVFRTTVANGLRNTLSEFLFSAEADNGALSASERILISQVDGDDAHNAGDLHFGPDGYLYVALGNDRPVLDDASEFPQAIDKAFFGGILRIDVDNREGNLAPNPHPAIFGEYRIPRDNPFVGSTTFNGRPVDPTNVRTEFFAVGLRNPWRFTFKPLSNELIVGEVGEGVFEEINLVHAGQNFGWPYYEGSQTNLWEADELASYFTPPVHVYPHGSNPGQGRVVIGGMFYAGQDLQALIGKYLFGDFETGDILALDLYAPGSGPRWLTASRGVVAFGPDPRNNEPLLVNFLEGTVQKLVYVPPESSGLPVSLAETGLFEDLTTLKVTSTLKAYDINTPFWSDNAIKSRWFSLADADAEITFRKQENWDFPAGALWLKHFELELTNGVPSSKRRIETRVLIKSPEGGYGLSYRWDEAGQNAFLVPAEGMEEIINITTGGTVVPQKWQYPSWQQCKTCHTKEGGFALGFNTLQLNRKGHRSETNQLAALAELGYFVNGHEIVPEAAPKLADLNDENAPPMFKARSWLHSNCVACHQPGGSARMFWDARITTPLSAARLVDAMGVDGQKKIIVPHSPSESYLFQRIRTRDLYQMPPFASSIADPLGLTVISNWIATLPSTNWNEANVGGWMIEGSASQVGDEYTVSGSGTGIQQNSFFFLFRESGEATSFEARLLTNRTASLSAEGGIMLRADTTTVSPYAALYRKGKELVFETRSATGGSRSVIGSLEYEGAVLLKLLRQGGGVSGWWRTSTSSDWQLLGVAENDWPEVLLAGMTSAGGTQGVEFNNAVFDQVVLESVHSFEPPGPITLILPQQLSAAVNLDSDWPGSRQVQFRLNGEEIASIGQAPWRVVWHPGRTGAFNLDAVMVRDGSSLTSPPVKVTFQAPATSIWQGGLDSETVGDWKGVYGTEAYLLPAAENTFSEGCLLQVLQGNGVFLQNNSRNSSALEYGNTRIISRLEHPEEIWLEFSTDDFLKHLVSLYFLDTKESGFTYDISIIGPEDSSILGEWRVPIGARGIYSSFAFQGRIKVRIRNPAGWATVNGIFCDPVPAPQVAIVSPEAGSVLQQPTNLSFEAQADSPMESLEYVELWLGNQMLARKSAPPYATIVTNISAGSHLIRAVAMNKFSVSATAQAVVDVRSVPAAARFLGYNSVTGGSWKEHYGGEGFWVFGETPVFPPEIEIVPSGARLFFWEYPSTARSALQSSELPLSFAGCFVGFEPWSIDFNFRDGREYKVALYGLDWDGARGQALKMEDPATGAVLTEQIQRDFNMGQYSVWVLKGSVRLRATPVSGNSVLSGLFLDSYDALTAWKHNWFTVEEIALGGASDQADPDEDGVQNLMEYALGLNPEEPDALRAISWESDGHALVVKVRQGTADPNISLFFEVSSDLLAWSRTTKGVAVVSLPEGGQQVTYRSELGEGSHQFIRFGIERGGEAGESGTNFTFP